MSEDVNGRAGVPDIEYRDCKQRILLQLLDAGRKEREQFMKEGDQINVFAFGGKDGIAEHLESYVPHVPRMNKAGQFNEIIGSNLYEQNPTRRVEPRPYSPPEAALRATRMEEYLNYLPRETNLKIHFKRMISQACIYGKGVLWVGWDKEKSIVTASFDPVQNFLLDPDAKSPEEANWKGRERQKPRWWLQKNIPDAKELIETASPTSKKQKSSKGKHFTTDTITFYEIYMKIGLHNYDGGEDLLKEDESTGKSMGDDTPMVYVITSDGKLLQERPWEVPLYAAQLWPCVELNFIENPGCLYPKSPIWFGLSQLQNMNWLYRHMMARVRQSARGFLVLMAQNGVSVDSEDLDKLLDVQPSPDGVWDLLRINAGAMGEGVNINQVIQQLTLESNMDHYLKAISFEEEEFAKSTGLYGILFQGQTETQMRSAKEVQFREKTSRSRIEDMLKSVETCSDELSTVQAMYAKFLSTEEDIIPILGQQGSLEWGYIMPSVEEETQRLTMELLEQGAPPEIAMELGQMKAQEQDMMLRQQGGITFIEWVKESNYTVQGGSTRRKDVDEEKEVYTEASNQLEPALYGSQRPELMIMALDIAFERFKLFGAPQTLLNTIREAQQVLAIPPPLPPPPMGGGGVQPGASPEAPPGGI